MGANSPMCTSLEGNNQANSIKTRKFKAFSFFSLQFGQDGCTQIGGHSGSCVFLALRHYMAVVALLQKLALD